MLPGMHDRNSTSPRRPARNGPTPAPWPFQSRVLLDADGAIVVDKPAGMASTGRTLADRDCVQAHLEARLRRRVWAVHQLDRDTSGVNVFVRRKSLVAEWTARLKAAGDKRYLAVTAAAPTEDRRLVETGIGWHPGQGRQAVIPRGRLARTEVEVLSRGPDAALLLVRLLTGRTHQARIHLAHIGCPILGEPRYGPGRCTRHPRHALHAVSLTLSDVDPPLHLLAPMAEDLVALCARLELAIPARFLAA